MKPPPAASRYGLDVKVEPIDLKSPDAAARLKNSLDESSISIDILVNNAGYGLRGEFLETPIERTVDMIRRTRLHQRRTGAGMHPGRTRGFNNGAPKSSEFGLDLTPIFWKQSGSKKMGSARW